MSSHVTVCWKVFHAYHGDWPWLRQTDSLRIEMPRPKQEGLDAGTAAHIGMGTHRFLQFLGVPKFHSSEYVGRLNMLNRFNPQTLQLRHLPSSSSFSMPCPNLSLSCSAFRLSWPSASITSSIWEILTEACGAKSRGVTTCTCRQKDADITLGSAASHRWEYDTMGRIYAHTLFNLPMSFGVEETWGRGALLFMSAKLSEIIHMSV